MNEIEKLKSEILKKINENKVSVTFSFDFEKQVKKLDNTLKIKLYKQILKIIDNPKVGKYMKYSRKNEQEVYLKPFRIYYCFYENEKKLRFVEFSHKDEQ